LAALKDWTMAQVTSSAFLHF
jgi:hypothetical protein